MKWSFRIVSWLFILTLGYAWTVGQAGVETANRNLCELWANTIGPLQSCKINELLVLIWILGAAASLVFLFSELVRWVIKAVKQRKALFRALSVQDEKLAKTLAGHETAVERSAVSEEAGKKSNAKFRRALDEFQQASQRFLIGGPTRDSEQPSSIAPSGLSVRLNAHTVTIDDYSAVCAIVVKNNGTHDLARCTVQIDQYSGTLRAEAPFPLALRAEEQIRRNQSGAVSLSAGQTKSFPVIFRSPQRANEWFFFDEFGAKHLVDAGPTKIVLGVYGEGKPERVLLTIDTDAGWQPVPSVQSVQDDFSLPIGLGITAPSEGRRIAVLEALKLAERKYGWDFHGQESLDVLDFIFGLHQAGVDDDIKFFGRPNRNDFESLTRDERLVAIESSHWRDYELDIWKALAEDDNFFIWTLNKRSRDVKKGGFADIHADRRQLVAWIASEANKYRGHTRRPAQRVP